MARAADLLSSLAMQEMGVVSDGIESWRLSRTSGQQRPRWLVEQEDDHDNSLRPADGHMSFFNEETMGDRMDVIVYCSVPVQENLIDMCTIGAATATITNLFLCLHRPEWDLTLFQKATNI
jgi:hypothetical protein